MTINKTFKNITLLWLIFFLAVGLVTGMANFRFNLYGDTLYPSQFADSPARNTVNTWKFWHNLYRWDAGWYSQIVSEGYDKQSIAFFPLYPATIKVLKFIWGDKQNVFINIAFIVSLASVWYLLFIYKKLLEKINNNKNDLFPLLLLLFFPTSFFLAAPYSETLFILLLLSSVYLIKAKRYTVASILIFLLSLSRVNGVFFLIFPLYLFFSPITEQKGDRRLLFLPVASLAGLASFLVYQKIYFHSFFAFTLAQKAVWGRDIAPGIVALYNRYAQELSELTRNFYEPSFVVASANVFFAMFALLSIVLMFRYWKKEYAILCLALMILPFISGLTSIPRYVLPIVPFVAMMITEKIQSETARQIILIFSVILWTTFLIAFSRLYWVA